MAIFRQLVNLLGVLSGMVRYQPNNKGFVPTADAVIVKEANAELTADSNVVDSKVVVDSEVVDSEDADSDETLDSTAPKRGGGMTLMNTFGNRMAEKAGIGSKDAPAKKAFGMHRALMSEHALSFQPFTESRDKIYNEVRDLIVEDINKYQKICSKYGNLLQN